MADEEIQILRSGLFEDREEFQFGFSTAIGGISPAPLGLNLGFVEADSRTNVIENRNRFFGALRIGMSSLAMPIQTHTSDVRVVYKAGGYEKVDGLATNTAGLFLGVSVADCVPVFIADPKKRCLAAVHAGWRGSSGGITGKMVELLKTEYGSSPADFLCYIGPAAASCCYEVGEEVSQKFPERYSGPAAGGKFLLDLIRFNKDQLLAGGVPESQIEIYSGCTIHESGKLHSFRRDRERSGRMIGVLGLIR